jgi:hypothetical protein
MPRLPTARSPRAGSRRLTRAQRRRRPSDGRFNALIHTGVVAMTDQNNVPEPFIFPGRCVYSAGSFKLAVWVASMDMLANTFMRARLDAIGDSEHQQVTSSSPWRHLSLGS